MNVVRAIEAFPGVEFAHYSPNTLHLAVYLKQGADLFMVKAKVQELIDLRCLNRSFETINYYTEEVNA